MARRSITKEELTFDAINHFLRLNDYHLPQSLLLIGIYDEKTKRPFKDILCLVVKRDRAFFWDCELRPKLRSNFEHKDTRITYYRTQQEGYYRQAFRTGLHPKTLKPFLFQTSPIVFKTTHCNKFFEVNRDEFQFVGTYARAFQKNEKRAKIEDFEKGALLLKNQEDMDELCNLVEPFFSFPINYLIIPKKYLFKYSIFK